MHISSLFCELNKKICCNRLGGALADKYGVANKTKPIRINVPIA